MAGLHVLPAIFVIAGMIAATSAREFYVGGGGGWIQTPKESYNSWAARMRFQINDTLVFKYGKGDDSVLLVKREDYDACNVQSPIQRLEGGESAFRFDRSGPFFFISGVSDRCSRGEKLVVVVLADRTKRNPIPPPPRPLPQPPASSPPSASLPPSPSPASAPPPSASLPPSPSPASVPPPAPSPVPVGVPPPAGGPSPGSGGPTGNEPASEPSQSAPPAKSASPGSASRVTIGGVAALVLAHAFLG